MSFFKKKLSMRVFFICLTLLCLSVCFFSLFLGRYPISFLETLGILGSKIFPVEPFWNPQAEGVLLHIRLPRVLLSALVGGALCVAGASYQGVFQNPMASPDILGASSGAGFGAALALLFGFSQTGVIAFAFCFSLLSTFFVCLIAKKAKGRQILALILCGIVISSLFSAATSFVKLVSDPLDELPAITYWLMGSFSGADERTLLFAFFPIFLGLLPLFLMRWKMNILTLGDEEARTLGVNAPRLRLWIIFSATLLTASSVAVSGLIGWVGLLVPHIARRFVGENFRFLLPASFLIGLFFLPLIDNLSRNLLTSEIPIGLLTAFVGAPFFLYLMVRKENPL